MTVASPIAVHEGRITDLPEVMVVMREAFDPQYGEAWTEPQCAGILGMPGNTLVIARISSQPAGFAMARALSGEAELLLIAVRPRFRRQGVGKILLDRIIADTAAAGATALHLEVRADNDALRLYCSAGFVQIGRRPAYYRGRNGKMFDALTYKRLLGAN